MVAAISSLVARSGVIGGGGIEEQYKFVALKPTPQKKEGGREGVYVFVIAWRRLHETSLSLFPHCPLFPHIKARMGEVMS